MRRSLGVSIQGQSAADHLNRETRQKKTGRYDHRKSYLQPVPVAQSRGRLIKKKAGCRQHAIEETTATKQYSRLRNFSTNDFYSSSGQIPLDPVAESKLDHFRVHRPIRNMCSGLI
jgi:hypothetical protein